MYCNASSSQRTSICQAFPNRRIQASAFLLCIVASRSVHTFFIVGSSPRPRIFIPLSFHSKPFSKYILILLRFHFIVLAAALNASPSSFFIHVPYV